MVRLQTSKILGRPIRQDSPAALGIATRTLLEAAWAAGRTAEAIEWLDYLQKENATIREVNCVWLWHLVRHILDRRGNQTWPALVQESLAPWIGTTAGLPGRPLASAQLDGQGATLRVPGARWDFCLREGDQRFSLTLGPPEAQAARWAGRRRKLEDAIRADSGEAVQRLLDEQLAEERLIHDIYGDWGWALLTLAGRAWGEAVLGDVMRATQGPWVRARYGHIAQMSAEEALQQAAEGMRGHFAGPRRWGEFEVRDEPDRYVMSFDACGSGGRMRRGDPLGGGSRLDPPYNFLNVEGAYPWTWNRRGVCAYCAHCAVALQMIPIEQMGRPMRLVVYPEQAGDPCQWIIYKRADLFPAEAYTAVGKEAPCEAV